MKKLILAILLVPSLLLAEPLPQGCYVAFNNPSQCYSATYNTTVLFPINGTQNELNQIFDLYGSTMMVVLDRYGALNRDFNSCEESFDTLLNDYNVNANSYNSLLSEYNTLFTDYEFLNNDYNRLLKVIRRLRAKIKRLS